MLRTNTGLLLVEEKWKNGEPFRSDRLGVLFGNHAREQNITGRSFKHWRKTAGNLIEQHDPSLNEPVPVSQRSGDEETLRHAAFRQAT